jgi:hypothetical protein
MEERNSYKDLAGKPGGKILPRWGDNFKMYLTQMACDEVNGIYPAQNTSTWWTVVSAVTNLLIP